MRSSRLTKQRARASLRLLTAVTLFGLACVACRGSAEEAEEPQPEAPTPRLVFHDEFERGELSPEDWQTSSDAWSLVDGEIHVAGARNEGLWFRHPLPDQVHISFDARALSDEGDIKFEIFTDGQTHQSGYVGIFGGWSNQLNIIARLDEHGDDRLVGAEGQHVVPNQTYSFAIERRDGTVSWMIDDVLFLAYEDSAPLTGDGHRYFGFNDWDAPVRFDNFRVFDLSGEP